MDTTKNTLQARFDYIKEDLKSAFVFTFLWGMATYGYMFLSNNVSFDSIMEFRATQAVMEWKISLGRILIPVYLTGFRGTITYQWVIGLLSLSYIALAVFLVIRIFDIHSRWMQCLTAGIMTVNVAFIALAATFIEDMDIDTLAMLLAVIAVYGWKHYRGGAVIGAVCLAMSLSLYQSYISTTIALVMMVCILELLDGESAQEVLKKGFRAIGMLLAGGLLYFCMLKITLAVTGLSLSSGNYNSIDKAASFSVGEILVNMVRTELMTIRLILLPTSYYPGLGTAAIQGLLVLLAAILVIGRMSGKDIGLPEKLLALTVIVMMPLGMNISAALAGCMSHDLMQYALGFIYLFVLLLADWAAIWKPFGGRRGVSLARPIASVLILVMLWGNIRLSNMACTIKDYESDAARAFMTRVIVKMEDFNGYVTGETPVAFVGTPDKIITKMPGCDQAYNMFGMNFSYPWDGAMKAYWTPYFNEILLNPTVIAEDELVLGLQESTQVKAMPAYPADGCMAMIDGTLVVKLG